MARNRRLLLPLLLLFLFGDSIISLLLLLSAVIAELKEVFLIHVTLPLGRCLHFDTLSEYHVGQCGTQLLVEVLGAQDELVVAGQVL